MFHCHLPPTQYCEMQESPYLIVVVPIVEYETVLTMCFAPAITYSTPLATVVASPDALCTG